MARVFDGMFIGGRPISTGKTFADLNPSDGSVWAEVPDGGRQEARAAIEAAHAAFGKWSALPFNKRAHYMIKVAEVFERRQMEIVEALQGEGGGWFGKGMFETGYVPEIFYAAAASSYAPIGEVIPSEHGKLSMAVRQPMGVVSVISPWNFPVLLTGRGGQYGGAQALRGDAVLRRAAVRGGVRGSRRPRGRAERGDLFARECPGGR